MSATGQPPAVESSGWTARRIITDAGLTITTVLTILAILAIWANRQLLNAENWASTSSDLLENPAIRGATANYLVDQLYDNINIAASVSSALPPRLQPLAAPVAGALRNAAVKGTELALSRPLVQTAWADTNRAADQALITIVDGGGRDASITGGVVTLNLRSILDEVATRLGLPENLGAKLPANAAKLTIMRSRQLKLVQTLGDLLSGLATVLYIVVPLLYTATLVIARGRRRRTLVSIGVSGIVAGLVVSLVRSLIVSAVPSTLVKDASVRPAAAAAASIATSTLTEIAGATVLIGAVTVVCGWFAGPSRFAVPARRTLAPILREEPTAAFATVGALMLLIFIWQPIPATGQPVGMLVFAVLAAVGTAALRRQSASEFPPKSRSLGPDTAAAGPAVVNETTLSQRRPTAP